MPDAAALLAHDAEAEAYGATRGGVPRAGAAAAAVLGLLPPHARTLLDLGCGTGIVTARLAALPGPEVARPEPAYRAPSFVRA
ncbi:class I SAM-dependent methyltransferase [Streptomyces lavendulae]|uniref:class I SAM-dependent methyltransferase n=1 Tax=Streptomyces lavendulae TaxID=1914 RepID=UPI003F4CB44F